MSEDPSAQIQSRTVSFGLAVVTPLVLYAAVVLIDTITLGGGSPHMNPVVVCGAVGCFVFGTCLWRPIYPMFYVISLALTCPLLLTMLSPRVTTRDPWFGLLVILAFGGALALGLPCGICAVRIRRWKYPDWVPLMLIMAAVFTLIAGQVTAALRAR